MNFQDALQSYVKNQSKENLYRQIDILMKEMTLKEKMRMLSGHGLGITLKNVILHKRFYNYEGLPSGGCKRLGIPTVKFSDGPRGVVMRNSTCFPVSMCRASAFDEKLEAKVNTAIAKEVLAHGANYFAGICINLVRNPRWGRSQETYGEDPYVLGVLGAAATKAVQSEGVIACPKHFACNSIEDLRFSVNVTAEERTLREVYLPHFKKCVDAGALSIMGAYNRLNDHWCCESKYLLTDILRKEWGFDGYTISDFVWGVHDFERGIIAGMDVEMMIPIEYTQKKIQKALKKGYINEAHIDRSVKNILSVILRMKPLEKEYDRKVIASKEHTELAREVAEKGMVLLKNNGILPLIADAKIMVTGDYAQESNIGDIGSSRVFCPYIISHYEGIKNVWKDAVCYNGTDVAKALETAKEKDIVIVTAGSNSSREGETMINYGAETKPEGKGGDRISLRLSKEEIILIKELKKAGKKVIVALFSGSAIITNDFKDYADAIIMNYYSGLEGGTAFANLLSGNVNFSGKLPFTVANNEDDYPPFKFVGDKPYEIEYGYYHGYTLFDKNNIIPEYPFGFGLSYTTFQISNISVENTTDKINVTVSVKNTGAVDGADVVQVYFGSNGADQDRPVKLLKGFRRVPVKAGEEQVVTIEVEKEDIKFFHPITHQWELDKEYTICVGDDCLNAVNLKQSIEV